MERFGITQEEMSDEVLTNVLTFIRARYFDFSDVDFDGEQYVESVSKTTFVESIMVEFDLTSFDHAEICEMLIDEVRTDLLHKAPF